VPKSLAALRRAWPSLPEPSLDAMAGTFDGEFVGPARLLSSGLAACGMPGWHGKRFDTPSRGINRLLGGTGFPMFAELGPSWADGRLAIVATYGPRERPPFRWVRDEFRPWDERTLVGLSFLDAPGLRRLGVPFLLHRAA
jgi:hypothetical protein